MDEKRQNKYISAKIIHKVHEVNGFFKMRIRAFKAILVRITVKNEPFSIQFISWK